MLLQGVRFASWAVTHIRRLRMAVFVGNLSDYRVWEGKAAEDETAHIFSFHELDMK